MVYHETVALLNGKKSLTKFEMGECAFILVAVVATIVYEILMYRKKFCHPNLHFLLRSLPIVHTGNFIVRLSRHFIILNFTYTDDLLYWMEFSRDVLGAGAICIILMLSVERLIAIIYTHTYDEMFKTSMLGVFLFIVAMCFTALNIALYYNDIVPRTLFIASEYATCLLTASIYVVLYYCCNHTYRKTYLQKNASVEERYNTTQNLRAAKILVYIAPFKCISTMVILVIYQRVWQDGIPSDIVNYSWIFFYFFTTQLIGQICLTIWAAPMLRREFWAIFGLEHTINPMMTTANGQKLVTGGVDENYFDRIKYSWDSEFDKKFEPMKNPKQLKYSKKEISA